jgi:hypothetical protein
MKRVLTPMTAFLVLFAACIVVWSWSRLSASAGGRDGTGVRDAKGLMDTARLLSPPVQPEGVAQEPEGRPDLVDFLEGAQVQYESEAQRLTILGALEDTLALSVEDLKARRYCDDQGSKGQWDLRTLVTRHLVPDSREKSLGFHFYSDVKSQEAMARIETLIEEIRKHPAEDGHPTAFKVPVL